MRSKPSDWLAAVSLFALAPICPPPSADEPVAWYAEKAFQASAQLLAKTLFAQGDVSYLEAVNQGASSSCRNRKRRELTPTLPAATLFNAFQRMVDVGVLLTRRSTSNAANASIAKIGKDGKPKLPKKPASVPLMALHPDWVPRRQADGTIAPQGRLWEFVDRLSKFRREGKKCVSFPSFHRFVLS